MAQKIVELREGLSNSKYKINRVNVAQVVQYSSSDTKKGTIDARLTKLKG